MKNPWATMVNHQQSDRYLRCQRKERCVLFLRYCVVFEVEGYYEIIKEPMDFMTMKEKIEQGAYKSLEQFE
ncbi:hypothetical protein IFM89_022786, partial [Coptis chinensis]